MARKKSVHKLTVGKSIGARRGKKSRHYHAPGVKHGRYKAPALHTR